MTNYGYMLNKFGGGFRKYKKKANIKEKFKFYGQKQIKQYEFTLQINLENEILIALEGRVGEG